MRCTRAIAPQTDLTDRLYWALSRLVNHGWMITHLGLDGSLAVQTPDGNRTEVGTEADPSEPALERQASTLLNIVARGSSHRPLAIIGARLRLHAPAGRPHRDDQGRPWRLPAPLTHQPAPEVRSAYWVATTLTDDYGWQLNALRPSGFDAVVPGREDDPLRYRSRDLRRNDSTADALVHRLAVLEPAAVDELSALLDCHARHRRLPVAQGVRR